MCSSDPGTNSVEGSGEKILGALGPEFLSMDGSLPDTSRRFRRDLLEWANENLRQFPWREEDRTFYEVFVAEFFLTQTPPGNVDRLYPEFLSRFPQLGAIDDTSLEDLKAAIEPIGFQRMRSEALKEAAASHDELPRDPDQLQTLTRVGPYVANATVSFALSRRVPILDRNVLRVYRRVFGDAFPETEADRERFAEEMLPAGGSRARTFNLALIDFGAMLCTKRDPECERCFAKEYCRYYLEEQGESIGG